MDNFTQQNFSKGIGRGMLNTFIKSFFAFSLCTAYAFADENITPPVQKNLDNSEKVYKSTGSKNDSKENVLPDLMDVYEKALAFSPSFKEQLFINKSSQESIKEARASLFPQIGYSVQTGKIKSEQSSVDVNTSDTYDSSSASINLSQTIYNRQQHLALSISKESASITDIGVDTALQELQLSTATAYLNLLSSQDSFLTATKQVENTKAQFEQAEQRYELGLGTATDYFQTQARLSLAESDVVASQNNIINAQQQLQALTGEYFDTLQTLSEDYPLDSLDDKKLDEWIEEGLKNNTQLIQQKHSLNVLKKNISLEKAGRLPSLNLVGSQTYSDTENNDSFNGRNDNGQVFVQLEGSLFQGGRVSSKIKQAQYDYDAGKANYDNTVLQLKQSITNSYYAVQSSKKLVSALKSAYDASLKTYNSFNESFAAGLVTSTDLLDATRDRFDAQSQYFASRYQHAINELTLKQQAGILTVNDLQELSGWLEDKI